MKTSTAVICGFCFYIEWDGNRGVDQNGHIWLNPDNPELENKELVDIYLDAYNTILKKIGKV